MNESNVAEPSNGKEDSDKDNSECASKELDYGSEDLPIFTKKKGLPCVPIKGMFHGVKGVMEFSYSKEGGSNLQMVEIKRPRTCGPTHKNLRKKKKIWSSHQIPTHLIPYHVHQKV